MMTARRFVLIGLAIGAMGIGPLPAHGAPALDTLHVVFQPTQSNGGLYVAETEGYFQDARIRVEWVTLPSAEHHIPLLVQGRLDVGTGPLTATLFNAVAGGERVRVVSEKGHVGGRNTTGSVLIRRDLAGVVRSAGDLKGRKIALPGGLGNASHYLLMRALATAGVALNQVTVISMPVPASLAALETGAVDATILPIPLDAQAVERGFGVKLLDFSDVLPGEPISFITYGRSLLETNRALGTRFMVAYLRGARRYAEGPTPRNVEIIAKYLKVEPAVVRKSGWAAIHPDGFLDVNRLRRFQDWLWDLGLITVRNPIFQVVDLSFTEDAKAALRSGGP